MLATTTPARTTWATQLATPSGVLVAGLLSGTSCDGVDVVLCRVRLAPDGADLLPPELVASQTVAYEDLPGGGALRQVLLSWIEGRATEQHSAAWLGAIACAHRDIAQVFAHALQRVEALHNVRVDLVGSHGQTVWHHDGHALWRGAQGQRATLQLGDLSTLAACTQRAVVGDFRWADLAAGGEGAPLVALVDHLLFPQLPRPAAILNLGGIANLTLLGARTDELLAFDVGPANCILDTLARELLGRACDEDGACALSGRVQAELLRSWASHPYFAVVPPKSTGRDTFSRAWVLSLLEPVRHSLSPADLLATAVELVALTVGEALARYGGVQPGGARPGPLVVAGGGALNPALMRALERHCGAVCAAEQVGTTARAREGLLFALLAARHVAGLPSTHPGATGARRGGVLGLYAPAPHFGL